MLQSPAELSPVSDTPEAAAPEAKVLEVGGAGEVMDEDAGLVPRFFWTTVIRLTGGTSTTWEFGAEEKTHQWPENSALLDSTHCPLRTLTRGLRGGRARLRCVKTPQQRHPEMEELQSKSLKVLDLSWLTRLSNLPRTSVPGNLGQGSSSSRTGTRECSKLGGGNILPGNVPVQVLFSLPSFLHFAAPQSGEETAEGWICP